MHRQTVHFHWYQVICNWSDLIQEDKEVKLIQLCESGVVYGVPF